MPKRTLAAMLILFLLCCPLPAADQADYGPKPPLARQVIFVPVWGEITHRTIDNIERRLRAKRLSGRIVVLDLDTPGGLVVAADRFAKLVDQYPHMRFIAFISGEIYTGAWSAGAFMSFCCEKIYIKSGKSIGAAMLVTRVKGVTDRAEPKFEAAWAAAMRGIAQKNGYPGALAEAMVVPETELWLLPGRDRPRILTGLEYNALPEQDRKRAQQIKKKDTILALTDHEARKYGIATILAQGDLAVQLGIAEEEHKKFYIFWRSARRKARAVLAQKARDRRTLHQGMTDLKKMGLELEAEVKILDTQLSRSRLSATIKRLKKYKKLAHNLSALARDYPEFRASPEEFSLTAKQAGETIRVLQDLKKRLPR